MSAALDIVVIYGSVRSYRRGIGLARYLVRRLEARGHTATLIDPAEYRLPMVDYMYKEYAEGEAPAPLPELAERYRVADGFLIVSGEYNHGIPPALKNLLDHFLEEYFFRPSAIACYSAGSFGGVRAAMQLRATLAELGMPSVSSLLAVPTVHEAFATDGTPREPDRWARRSDRFLDDLEWWARAARRQREAHGTPF